jgi:uracil-DNA glycosylase family 4
MDALRRNQYLQTIGVDVWVPRSSAADAASAVAAEQADSRATAPSGARVPDAGIGVTSADTMRAAPGLTASTNAGAATVGSMRPASVDAGVASSRATHAGAVDGASGRIAQPTAASMPTAATSHSTPTSVVASPLEGSPTVTTWESLRSEVLACTKCTLHASRTQGVFGVGNREAQWLVVGEAPGAEEDRRGEPFVGRAGHLLDAMLKAIGLSRGRNVYIANVLKSRPPGNRDPKPEEVAACLPYLMRQIELLRPRVMLAVGRIAAQNLLATDVPLGRLRGKVHHFGELNTPLIVTYHPAYLLRTPSDKRKAWEDLKFARSVFQGLNPT